MPSFPWSDLDEDDERPVILNGRSPNDPRIDHDARKIAEAIRLLDRIAWLLKFTSSIQRHNLSFNSLKCARAYPGTIYSEQVTVTVAWWRVTTKRVRINTVTDNTLPATKETS